MNRQPFRTPPCWWSPQLSPRWMRFWRPLRRRRSLRMHGLTGIEVQGQEHIQAALAEGYGVLITPNHPTHADPFVLLEIADQLRTPFFFMTAWQVFALTHWLGRRVLRQHGCFSINREGHDLRAFRQAVDILHQNRHPLVIFPEGEVLHLNDRVTHFRRGAATIALRAAHRSGRPIACIPCGMKFHYVSDPRPELEIVMGRLERQLSWSARPDMPLARRIHRLAEGVLNMKELQYLGFTGTGSMQQRSSGLMTAILGRLEDRYRIHAPRAIVPERVKQLRRLTIARLEAATDAAQRNQCERDMEDLFFVMQLFSYPTDYLAGNPSIERLAETVDKLEEDILHVPTAGKRGLRRATVAFGEPVLAEPNAVRHDAAPLLTEALQHGVQGLLDAMNQAKAPAPLPMGDALPVEEDLVWNSELQAA